jgi:hypothetical protein
MLAHGDRDWERAAGACSTYRGTGGLAAICAVQQSPLGPWSPLDVKSPPLDFALPPLEVVWHSMPLGDFVFSFVALLPLLLMLCFCRCYLCE